MWPFPRETGVLLVQCGHLLGVPGTPWSLDIPVTEGHTLGFSG